MLHASPRSSWSSWSSAIVLAFVLVLGLPSYVSGQEPTPEPTMILVPATPTLTPGPEATSEAEYLSDIRTFQRSSFVWAIFVGLVGLGLLILIFLRVQL